MGQNLPSLSVLHRPVCELNTYKQGAGYPILCLHGHPGSGSSMLVFTNHLSQRFYTLAPDLRGYGQSSVGVDFEMSEHLLDLEALLDGHAVKQCLVLGWSLGGILALELALKLPQRVSGLILVATAARPVSTHPRVNWQDLLYTGLAGVINQVIPAWDWNINTLAKRSLFRYLLAQHNPQAYQFLAEEGVKAYLKTSQRATRALQKALQQGYNRLSDLKQIQCPCLVLAGEQDRHICAASSTETASYLSDCVNIIYPNAAHLFPWEIPDQVLKDIDQWIEKHPQVVGQKNKST